MERKQLALFTILVLSGLSLGQLLNLEVVGVILGLLAGLTTALWILYDMEETEGKDVKSV